MKIGFDLYQNILVYNRNIICDKDSAWGAHALSHALPILIVNPIFVSYVSYGNRK